MNRPAEKVPHTVTGLLQSGTRTIGDASDAPDVDARILLQTLLKKDHAWLIAHGTESVDAAHVTRYYQWIERRARSKPLAYITGRKAFWTMELAVTRDVLVPRPETELLVERALGKIPLSEPLHILDLGTGSGAIGLAIAAERPLCKVTATDCSWPTLKIAEQNKGRLGLRNIDFQQGNWYGPLEQNRFSVIVCNPPYVPHSYYEATLSHEPRDALFSGERGLDALETVINGAGGHLEPGGWLLVEHGFDHKPSVQVLFQAAGYKSITTLDDHAGHPRVTEGRRADKA